MPTCCGSRWTGAPGSSARRAASRRRSTSAHTPCAARRTGPTADWRGRWSARSEPRPCLGPMPRRHASAGCPHHGADTPPPPRARRRAVALAQGRAGAAVRRPRPEAPGGQRRRRPLARRPRRPARRHARNGAGAAAPRTTRPARRRREPGRLRHRARRSALRHPSSCGQGRWHRPVAPAARQATPCAHPTSRPGSAGGWLPGSGRGPPAAQAAVVGLGEDDLHAAKPARRQGGDD
jgi:hypothetical protein